MKTVSNAYLNAVKDYGREFQNELVVTDGTHTETYLNAEIEIKEAFSETNALSMGKYFSKELKVKLIEPLSTVAYKNCSYKVTSKLKVGNGYEAVEMGVFYPSEVKKNDGSIEVTAYDMMSRLGDKYVPTVTAPCSPRDIVNDIATQKGFNASNVGLDGGTIYVTQLLGHNGIYSHTVTSQGVEDIGAGSFDIVADSSLPKFKIENINAEMPYEGVIDDEDTIVWQVPSGETVELDENTKYVVVINPNECAWGEGLGLKLYDTDGVLRDSIERLNVPIYPEETYELGHISLYEIDEEGRGLSVRSDSPKEFMLQLFDTTGMSSTDISRLVANVVGKHYYDKVTRQPFTFGTILDAIYEGTCAEQLGWLAGIEGKNAIFNENNKLEFRWYDTISSEATHWNDLNVAWQDVNGTWNSEFKTTFEMSRNLQVENGCSLDEGTFTINSITTGTEDNTITVGTGKGITFSNPYITQAQLQAIWNGLENKTYYTGNVETFGYPMLEVGDIVSVIDKEGNSNAFYLSNNSWKFVGGCHCASTSVGSPDAEVQFSTESPTEIKIKTINTDLKEAERHLSNIINTQEGVFSITEVDGVNVGWTIVDNPTNPQKVVVATNGGIGIGTNGLDGNYNTAITGEGIKADTITSGTLTVGGTSSDTILTVKDTSNNTIGEWNENGVGIYKGSIHDSSNHLNINVTNGTMSLKDYGLSSDANLTVQNSDNSKNTRINSVGINYTDGNVTGYTWAHGLYSRDPDTGYSIEISTSATGTQAYQLRLTGKAKANAWDTYSLEELKTDISPCKSMLETVNGADIYEFCFKSDKEIGIDKKKIGFVIGENRNTPQEVISYDGQGVDTYTMCGVLWKAVQELSQEVESLKQQLEEGGEDK